MLLPRPLLEARGVDVVEIERGGDVTYHGPGQVVVYPIRRLERFREVVPLVSALETAVTGALYRFGIASQPRSEHRGVYVGDDAICAIGLAVKRMTSLHGLALNACTALDYDRLITPCGTPQFGITSISAQLGREVSWAEARDVLLDALEGAFGVAFERDDDRPGGAASVPVDPSRKQHDLHRSDDSSQPAEGRPEPVERAPKRKPEWLKVRLPSGESYENVLGEVRRLQLHTVCQEAMCPNIGECWGAGTATIMILGDTCTRGCHFCNVKTGSPKGEVDWMEPKRVAEAVARTGLEVSRAHGRRPRRPRRRRRGDLRQHRADDPQAGSRRESRVPHRRLRRRPRRARHRARRAARSARAQPRNGRAPAGDACATAAPATRSRSRSSSTPRSPAR